MKNFIAEFKTFAMRGNVVDLAVAVIIGAAFGKIVSSLVDNIVMPLIGVALGGIDFTSLAATVAGAEVTYGIFIQRVIDFLIIALAVFVMVKMMNKVIKKEEKKEEEEKPKGPSEVELLTEIRDLLKR